jgi:hypothetical protein
MYACVYVGVKWDGCRSQKRKNAKNAKTQKMQKRKRKNANAKTQTQKRKRKNAKTAVDLRSLIAVLNQRFIPFFASKV